MSRLLGNESGNSKVDAGLESMRDKWPLGRELTQVAELWQQGALMVGGLEGAARACDIARLWMAAPKTILAVCPTLAGAEKLARDLEFFLGGGAAPVRLFPTYEVSPYREVDPPPEVTARRLSVLWELVEAKEPLLLVTAARGLGARLCPPEHLLDSSMHLKPGREQPREELTAGLARMGYTPVSLVEQVGDYAVRGGVVDLFAPWPDNPVRVEFFGDQVESLRQFDPVDQRSQTPLDELTIIPCQPVDLSPPAAARAVASLRKLAQEQGLSTRQMQALIERMELLAPFSGMENYLPLYFERAADLFDYLPPDAAHVVVEPAEVRQRFLAEAEQMAEDHAAALEEGRVVLPPPMMRRTPDQLKQRLWARPSLLYKALALSDSEDNLPLVSRRAGFHTGLHQELSRAGDGSLLSRFLEWARVQREEKGRGVLLVCRSWAQVNRLAELMAERDIEVSVIDQVWRAAKDAAFHLLLGGVSTGFTPPDLPFTLVTEDEVFGAPRVVRQKAPPKLSAMLAALDDLSEGDLVVHADHGVARYTGLVTLAVGAAESDFLHLVFAGDDKLYLPADRMGLISKYRGPGEHPPPLDRLGGKRWSATKGRVKKELEKIAADLVDLYAARRFQKGHPYPAPSQEYREFEAGFPFDETPDQAKAIEEVLSDMTAAKPMDRLICGDVGFGKTEVALRAVYLAASSGKQVAMLVPTTVLAEQHFQTFRERLVDTPVVVESLSRFKNPAKQKEVLAGLAEGKVNIVVGTHRLLQRDVVFKDLGLVVVDEEHRFGVKDKERLKRLRRLVDVLAMTATPIPRTLQMSLSGIRDLSVITTPPADRQSIKTYLANFNPSAVREAIEREMERGGQVFFVHNRVEDIAKVARMVQRLAPAARVGVAHGQQNERQLEKVMRGFIKKEVDVLVCTTIVESGLDIPNANTIIIDRADRMGLSQIYQLRGRVGRAGERAYAYLFVKSEDSLTPQAKKRLKALMDYTQLGAGFAIAMHDLEIRGAGNMLGEAQSGQVAAVGYELYLQMLEEAVAQMKGEDASQFPEPEMHLALPAHLPESYLPDAEVRLNLYRRLSRARGDDMLAEIEAELSDRFGPLPEPVGNLLAACGVKERLRRMGGHRLDLSEGGMLAYFNHDSKVDLERILALAGEKPSEVKVYPDGRVSLMIGPGESTFDRARQFLQYIGRDEACGRDEA